MENNEYISLAALIIGIIGALGHFVETAHLRKIKLGCLVSECMRTPATTPLLAPVPDIKSQGC